jgi:hypothetical protein
MIKSSYLSDKEVDILILKSFLEGNVEGYCFSLSPSQPSCIGIYDLFFNANDIEKLMVPKLRTLHSAKSCSVILKCKQESISLWVKSGFINGERGRHFVIPDGELKEFAHKYITSGQIAYELGFSSQKIRLILEQNEVFPVSGPNIDNGYTYLFLRKEVRIVFPDITASMLD